MAPGLLLAAGEHSARVYTAEDEGVAPPTMVSPKLPSEPRPDSWQSGSYIDVVVDERGQVQQVRLRSSDATLNDRMIVAAAKAWQFEPARKDGVAVKYVLRVPVTR
jgi:protein TonB